MPAAARLLPGHLERIDIGRASVAAGAAVILATATAVAANGEVSTLEASAFAGLNDLPDGLWPIVWLPMQAGSFAGSIVLVGAVAAHTRDRRVALAALAGTQTAYWGAKVLKRAVARGRPAALVVGAHERERTRGLGYPSGHTAVAFALAAAIAPSLGRSARLGAFATAAFVGMARLYVGAHLPLDVVG
ncbi:MAG TPA: phosphatase PAP2 family protein, partial [Acidimicrobiia bacterium]|nr:phosphatase PAP2 family protein [Acidimicrobiia bacterium]